MIANRFCDYFTNIGPNLAKQIPTTLKTASSYLGGNFAKTIFLEPASESEIIEMVRSLRSGSAAAWL